MEWEHCDVYSSQRKLLCGVTDILPGQVCVLCTVEHRSVSWSLYDCVLCTVEYRSVSWSLFGTIVTSETGPAWPHVSDKTQTFTITTALSEHFIVQYSIHSGHWEGESIIRNPSSQWRRWARCWWSRLGSGTIFLSICSRHFINKHKPENLYCKETISFKSCWSQSSSE